MQIGEFSTVTHWSKSYPVEALRITIHNMQAIADYFGGDFYDQPNGEETYPRVLIDGNFGYEGDLIIKKPGFEAVEIVPYDEFAKDFITHSERLNRDEKYALVFQSVISAMKKQASATYNQDDNGDMDIVAIDTTNVILGIMR